MKNELYEKYFQILEDNFGRYFNESNPIESVEKLLKQQMTSRILYETSDEVVNEIFDLFENNQKNIIAEINSLKGIRTHFCGSIAPQEVEKFLCQTGLYVDTTIIHDPITFVHSFKSYVNKPKFTELLFRHSFNMLKLKNALINDSETPMLRIIPKPIFLKDTNDIFDNADEQKLDYFNELFDEDFETNGELEKNILTLENTTDLINKISKGELLIPEITQSSDLITGFETFHETVNSQFSVKLDTTSKTYYNYVTGSMRSNLLDLNFSKDFRLINSFDSSNSWHIYKWMVKNQAKDVDKRTLIVNSLTLDKIKWFGNLKLDDVIIAREGFCLQEFREIIDKEMNFVDEDKDLVNVSTQISYNLENAFNKHQEELKTLERDYKFPFFANYAGVTTGSISLLYGVVNQDSFNLICGGLTLGSSLISLTKTIKNHYAKRTNLISSPLGLLFNVQS